MKQIGLLGVVAATVLVVIVAILNNDTKPVGADLLGITISVPITPADQVDSIVIAPFTPKLLTMTFKTNANYDGAAQFQAQTQSGDWVKIGPTQVAGMTVINGMDSIPAADYQLPLKIRVAVIKQTTSGQSTAQLDYLP